MGPFDAFIKVYNKIKGRDNNFKRFFEQKSLWIWTSDWAESDKAVPLFVHFRKEIKLTNQPEKAEIRISADSRYHLFINGASVVFGSCKGDDKVYGYKDTTGRSIS